MHIIDKDLEELAEFKIIEITSEGKIINLEHLRDRERNRDRDLSEEDERIKRYMRAAGGH